MKYITKKVEQKKSWSKAKHRVFISPKTSSNFLLCPLFFNAMGAVADGLACRPAGGKLILNGHCFIQC